jgi:hypothetical protein
MVKKGHNHPLTHPELWKLPEDYESAELWRNFEVHWNAQLALAKASPEKYFYIYHSQLTFLVQKYNPLF